MQIWLRVVERKQEFQSNSVPTCVASERHLVELVLVLKLPPLGEDDAEDGEDDEQHERDVAHTPSEQRLGRGHVQVLPDDVGRFLPGVFGLDPLLAPEELLVGEVVAADAAAVFVVLFLAVVDEEVPVLSPPEGDLRVEGLEVVMGLAFDVHIHDLVLE